MSKTYRFVNYVRGKPHYSRHQRRDSGRYTWFRHEFTRVRIELWRSYRRACREALKKKRDIPAWSPTRGWISK